jgi:hypothetical protein
MSGTVRVASFLNRWHARPRKGAVKVNGKRRLTIHSSRTRFVAAVLHTASWAGRLNSGVRGQNMTAVPRKRPKRLWVAALMNILLGLLALFTLGYVSISSNVPSVIRPSGLTTTIAIITAGFLIVSSALALLGKSLGRQLMLAAALLFYGILVVQNANMLAQPHEWLGPGANTKLTASVIRGCFEILINVWVLLSAKTRGYFALAVP